MTTYTAIPNGDIDPESPITTGLMTLLRDNPIAMFEKATGAPVLANNYVTQAMIAANTVGRSEIREAFGTSYAGSVGGGSSVNFTLNDYSFFPMIHTEGASSHLVYMTGHSTDGGSGSSPRFRLYNSGAVVINYDVDSRYIPS